MTIIKTLKDGRTLSFDGADYSFGAETGLKGSAPIKLAQPIGDVTHKISLWASSAAIGLTAPEAAALQRLWDARNRAGAEAQASYEANPSRYQRFQSTADRRDRAYTAQYDTDGEEG
jgi:hypothetical protein